MKGIGVGPVNIGGLELNKVLDVPKLQCNLLLHSKLAKMRYIIYITRNEAQIIFSSLELITQTKGSIYVINRNNATCNSTYTSVAQCNNYIAIKLCYRYLCYLNI